MALQHDLSWDIMERLVKANLRAKDAWGQFVDFHEQQHDAPYWRLLKAIEIEQPKMVNWLQLMFQKPLPENIIAIWIGIVKLSIGNKEIPAIYFSGADSYDQDDIDWACSMAYLPEDPYMQPAALQQIDDIAKTDEENYAFLDWVMPIAYLAFTLDEIIRDALNKGLFLKDQRKLHFAVGHDSGDYLNLSSFVI